jgi:hypothetical protein
MAKKAAKKPGKIGRPPVPPTHKKRPISASVDPAMVDALERYMKKTGKTMSQAVAEAVRRLVG